MSFTHSVKMPVSTYCNFPSSCDCNSSNVNVKERAERDYIKARGGWTHKKIMCAKKQTESQGELPFLRNNK